MPKNAKKMLQKQKPKICGKKCKKMSTINRNNATNKQKYEEKNAKICNKGKMLNFHLVYKCWHSFA